MTDLNLNGPLDLVGALTLVGQGGKVLVNGVEALVEQAEGQAAAPVIMPTPPASPVDTGVKVKCVSSLGRQITAAGKALVTTGMVLQGNNATWPGMITPSTKNTVPSTVTANGLPINVLNDTAVIFPNGGTATFGSKSGQQPWV